MIEESKETEAKEVANRHQEYWVKNLKVMGALLSVWFVASYGCGILLAEKLNEFRIPGTGFKVGFWFAQQGSIYIFVILIAVYVWIMNRLDQRYGVEEIDEEEVQGGEGI